MKNTVAIVGTPNVGKSRLFNRLIHKDLAIILDQPGTTRDRLYGAVTWLNYQFMLIDTGGFVLDDTTELATNINMQIDLAISEADLILFVISFKLGVSHHDEVIARKLQSTNKPVILVINKYDFKTEIDEQVPFYVLGFKKMFFVSAEHGIMIGDLLDEIIRSLPRWTASDENKNLTLTLIGKPNVGKSTLTNILLGEERVVTSHIPGTTTDSVTTSFVYGNDYYYITDTAGLQRKTKNWEKLKQFSWYRTQKAILESNIILLLVDASQPLTEYDKNIAGLAWKNHKAVIIIGNKCDLINNDFGLFAKTQTNIKKYFQFLHYAPVLMLSAINLKNSQQVFETLHEMKKMLNKTIKSHVLNDVIMTAQIIHPPAQHQGGIIKIYYITQVKALIPTIVFFVNNYKYLHFSYKRYLENQIRKNFNFNMIPIKLLFRNKK